MTTIPDKCPKCGEPRDLDCGDEATYKCGTWLLTDLEAMQSGECKVRVELNALTAELAGARGALEKISKAPRFINGMVFDPCPTVMCYASQTADVAKAALAILEGSKL